MLMRAHNLYITLRTLLSFWVVCAMFGLETVGLHLFSRMVTLTSVSKSFLVCL